MIIPKNRSDSQNPAGLDLFPFHHIDHLAHRRVHVSREPYGARIVSASFGGDAQVSYDGYGAPDTSGSVVIAVGSYQQSVDVTIETGVAKKKAVLIVE